MKKFSLGVPISPWSCDEAKRCVSLDNLMLILGVLLGRLFKGSGLALLAVVLDCTPRNSVELSSRLELCQP